MTIGRQGVDDRLVVDPPAREVAPGLLGGAARTGSSTWCSRSMPGEVLVVGEADRRRWAAGRGRRGCAARRPATAGSWMPICRQSRAWRGADPGLMASWRAAASSMAVSGGQPRAPGHRGAEPHERRVVGVALGHLGRPALPGAVEVGQLARCPEPVVPGQDLGAPGRGAGPGGRAGSPRSPGPRRPSRGWGGRRSPGRPPADPVPAATNSRASEPLPVHGGDAQGEDRRAGHGQGVAEVGARSATTR